MTQFWFAASSEEFTPSEMVAQATAASAAGGQTEGPLGTSVTPIVHHYHPGVVAQAFMSLEELFPGRVFLGAGSGEALNEIPLGLDWPSPGEKIERMDHGLEAIRRLWDG